MSEPTITRAEVRRCIDNRGPGLRFPPAVERAFETYRRRHQARVTLATIGPTLLIYNLFLIVDFLLLPQTFLIALVAHLLVVTPAILLAGWLVRREPGLILRESLTATIPLAMVAQILCVYALNSGPSADQYQFLVLPVLIYACVNQRLDFRFAAATTALIVAAYLAVLLPHANTVATQLVGLTIMPCVAYLGIAASYRMEWDTRYAFLRRLQDRLKREEAELAARHDPLTGLANRYALERRIESLQTGLHGSDLSVAALMIDVDHFKAFNDHHGHPEGDACLQRIAGALYARLRNDSDLAVRVGGEEFLVLLHGAGLADAVRIGERIRRAVEGFGIRHAERHDHGVVTVSIGAMAGSLARFRVDQLIDGADSALYAAKDAGRNRVWPPFDDADANAPGRTRHAPA